jgi:nucleotide-binding universal stress UspA family protein
MYSKILVPLDGSKPAEQALPYARLLAEATGAAVELLRITDSDVQALLGAAARLRLPERNRGARFFSAHQRRLRRACG